MTPPRGFEHDCETALSGLRVAVLELYGALGAPAEQPQEVARAFGLDKNLTWKVSRLLGTPDAADALQFLPGAGALRILLRAMEGAGSERVERVQSAYDHLDEVVQTHLGDRSTLQLVLDGIGPGRAEPLEASRKLAFRGNSGVWGVQARAKVTIAALAPNADRPDRLDTAFVRGYLGFRRLRSASSWPLSTRRDWYGDGQAYKPGARPLEPDQVENGLPILREFTTAPGPVFELRRMPTGFYFVLPPGPVGNSAAFDCFLGEVSRAEVPRYHEGSDRFGEFSTSITAPIEYQLLDVILHRDLAEQFEPEAFLYGNPLGERVGGSTDPTQTHLPLGDQVHRLPGSPPVVATPIYPRYTELVELVYRRAGWDPAAFVGYRLVTKYPPMGTSVSMRFALPERP